MAPRDPELGVSVVDPYAKNSNHRRTADLRGLARRTPYGQYITLAPKVLHLTELGMSQVAIALALGTSVRTIRRSIQWARGAH